MKFKAQINIMPLRELLDPKGKAVEANMKSIALPEISQVRIGKHINLEIEASSQEEAQSKVEQACQKMLANPVMESYEVQIQAV